MASNFVRYILKYLDLTLVGKHCMHSPGSIYCLSGYLNPGKTWSKNVGHTPNDLVCTLG